MAYLRHFLALVIAATLWVRPGFARGESTPVLVEMSVGPAVLDEAALREAIALELDCPVVTNRSASHSGEILIKSLSREQVSVTFVPVDNRPPLKRSLALPQTPERRVQLIAWLVGNLARNEAADWLANHQREKLSELAKNAAATPESSGPNAPKPVAPGDTAAQQPDAGAPSNLPVGNAANKRADTSDKHASGEHNPPLALTFHSFNLALWHRLLELHPDSETSRFALHLGLGYGRVGAIRGVGFDLLHHRSEVAVRGMVGSFGWTRAARTQGVAWSFGVVTAEQPLTGVDLAGLFAVREGDISGAQIAGFASIASGTLEGVQAAAVFAKHAGTLRGAELSYGVNWANAVDGVQFGTVNVAGDVRGVQFGLVNVAHRVDGIAIGLINVADNIRTQAELWSERNYLENVGVRYVVSPLTFGVSSGYDSVHNRVRFLAGLGVRFTYKQIAFAPSVDVGFVMDQVRDNAVVRGHENDLRLAFEWQLVPKVLAITAGPALALRSDSGPAKQLWPRWFAGVTVF
jgi:hypothetical protein